MVNEIVVDLGNARRIRSLEEQLATLRKGGGGGSVYGMEPRIAKLEASVGSIEREVTDLKSEVRGLRAEQRSDFRLLFGAVMTVALGLAALMAKGFHWL